MLDFLIPLLPFEDYRFVLSLDPDNGRSRTDDALDFGGGVDPTQVAVAAQSAGRGQTEDDLSPGQAPNLGFYNNPLGVEVLV